MSFRVLISRVLPVVAAVVGLTAFLGAQQAPERVPGQMPNPSKEPPIVTPGAEPGAPPSDAIVLFDGADLSKWVSQRDPSKPAEWTVADGAMQVKPGTGGIQTRDAFRDVQLHIEWAAPEVVKGEGQGRGNSGVFLMNTYEVQVLDSYQNTTYFHGQAASIYKQHKPLVNATRPPGQWNTYDIVFRAPAFDEDGKLLKRATFTVFHNGVLVQDHVEVMGVTAHDRPPFYEKHDDRMPLSLQDHGDLVRFRNIWIRELTQ